MRGDKKEMSEEDFLKHLQSTCESHKERVDRLNEENYRQGDYTHISHSLDNIINCIGMINDDMREERYIQK